MKKGLLLALSVIMMTGASVFAQTVAKSTKDSATTTVISSTSKVEPVTSKVESSTSKVEPVKTDIKTAVLPQPVKDLITTFKAQGWEAAENASSVKLGTSEIAYYEVTFKKTSSGESKSINIDALGKIVKQ
jgi:hypothetical protein